MHFSNDIFLFLPGYVCLFCQLYHSDSSLLLAFINIHGIIKQVHSFKFRNEEMSSKSAENTTAMLANL